jgi:hypothetical protein
MFLVLWEFDVKPGSEKLFENIYGPEGDWARFFQRDAAYQRTLLLRDPSSACTYVTCDFWDTRETYESFRRTHSDDYLALDKICEELTLAERKMGEFEQLRDKK